MNHTAWAARLSAIAVVLIVSSAYHRPLPAEETFSSRESEASIVTEELQSYVKRLASDQWEGREAGSRGGRAAGDYLQAELSRLGIRGAAVDGRFDQPFGVNCRNILGWIPGGDPRLRTEFVLICAHYDHVGYGTKEDSRGPLGQIHHGADDNASGTAVLLELAKVLSRLPRPPARSILLAFWDAEEKEMAGSRHWAAHPTVALGRVMAAINLDMLGRLRNDRLIVYGSRTASGFRRLMSEDNRHADLSLDFSSELEDDSDHYALVAAGIPTLYFYTGDHNDSHSPRDTVDRVNPAGMARIGQLVFRVVSDLAAREQPMVFRREALVEAERFRRQEELARLQRKGRLQTVATPATTPHGKMAD